MDGKVLIVDDVVTNRIVLRVKLGTAGYVPLIAVDGAECQRLAMAEAPDLIMLDIDLPDMSGVDLLYSLKSAPHLADVPIIALVQKGDSAGALGALRAGADDVVIKPFDDYFVMSRVRNLLRVRQELLELNAGRPAPLAALEEDGAPYAAPAHVIIASDRSGAGDALGARLTPLMRDSFRVMTVADVLAELGPGSDRPPTDLFIIDAEGSQAERGLRLLSDLRSRASTRHASICLIAERDGFSAAQMGFDLGADEVIDLSMEAEEIALRLRKSFRAKHRMDDARRQVQRDLRLAMTDPLTGLYNRRYANARLVAMCEAAAATDRPLAVLLLDIDRFKSVNDRFGHSVGDRVLEEVARRLIGNLRQSDLVARVGGEEFLIALPDLSAAEAELVARRLCDAVEQTPSAHVGDVAVTVTMSIGLSVWAAPVHEARMPSEALFQELVERADKALLQSKSDGRNRVTLGRGAA